MYILFWNFDGVLLAIYFPYIVLIASAPPINHLELIDKSIYILPVLHCDRRLKIVFFSCCIITLQEKEKNKTNTKFKFIKTLPKTKETA